MKECMPDDRATKYNYVFVNTEGEYLEPIFQPLKKCGDVRVYKRAFLGNALLQKLFFLHWSYRLNRKLRLPLKKIWFRKMVRQDFEEDKPICYVFLGGKYLTDEPKLYDYIKKQNPKNKCIIYCLDLISKKHWDVAKIKSFCDHIVTYDLSEAEQYSIDHYAAMSYGAITEVTEPEHFENDVYFLGFAKDRLEQIHAAYRQLSESGLKCKFIICGVPKEKQIKADGPIYSAPISYRENLENVKNSRCILEIMQGGSNAPTLRTEEAHIYRRKLLTNNTNLVGQPYYDASHMRVFSEAEQIDTEFVKEKIDYAAFDDSFDYSPRKMIDFFEKLLEN